MAAPALPDLDDLLLQLVRLERLEGDIERRLARAHDRNAAFPNEVSGRHVATLSAQLLEMRNAMDAIRAQLVPIMRAPERRA